MFYICTHTDLHMYIVSALAIIAFPFQSLGRLRRPTKAIGVTCLAMNGIPCAHHSHNGLPKIGILQRWKSEKSWAWVRDMWLVFWETILQILLSLSLCYQGCLVQRSLKSLLPAGMCARKTHILNMFCEHLRCFESVATKVLSPVVPLHSQWMVRHRLGSCKSWLQCFQPMVCKQRRLGSVTRSWHSWATSCLWTSLCFPWDGTSNVSSRSPTMRWIPSNFSLSSSVLVCSGSGQASGFHIFQTQRTLSSCSPHSLFSIWLTTFLIHLSILQPLFWHCAIFLSFRFQKKLPRPCGDTVNLASCLISLFRVRAEQAFWLASPGVRRLTKTLVSCWAQHAEMAIEKSMRRDCPDPCVESKYHPFTASSRRKGSKALQMVLVQRFAAKGGGFVTCKNEQSLQSLGVVQAGSSLGTRTASEYCVRALCATATFCAEYMSNARLKVINFAMDAASIGGEHATCCSFEPYIYIYFMCF